MAATFNQGPSGAPTAPDDLPPPYSAVVGNPQYGFVVPPGSDIYPNPSAMPKQYTPHGVYPHPPTAVNIQPLAGDVVSSSGAPVSVGIVIPQVAVGNEPTNVTCYNCGKTGLTRVVYTTAWHTHLVAGSLCIITMMCSLCCIGLIPYCFDSFKDAEHYCQHCNSFIGKSSKC